MRAATAVFGAAGRARPTWIEVVPVLVVVVLAIASVLVPDPSVAYGFRPWPSALVAGIAAVATLPLVLRRRFPSAGYVVELAAVFTLGMLHAPTGILPGVLGLALAWAAFASAVPASVSVLVLTMLAFAGLTLAGAPYFDSPLAVITVVTFTVLWGIGAAARAWRRSQAAAVSNAEARRADAERRAARMLDEERRRLARELHDSVSNSVTAVALQARALGDVSVEQDLQRGLRALEHESRAALVRLRQLLVLLRHPDGTSTPASRTMQDVIDAHRAQGGLVEIEFDGELDHVPSAVEHELIPIVGELLANARRHAPAHPVELHVARDGSGLRLRARNRTDGRGVSRPDSFGLIGIRERLARIGGSVEEIRGEDRFEVTVVIPDVEAGATRFAAPEVSPS